MEGATEAASGSLTARMQLLIWKSFQSVPLLFIYFCLFEVGRSFGLSSEPVPGHKALAVYS